jgi:hypothetical protein
VNRLLLGVCHRLLDLRSAAVQAIKAAAHVGCANSDGSCSRCVCWLLGFELWSCHNIPIPTIPRCAFTPPPPRPFLPATAGPGATNVTITCQMPSGGYTAGSNTTVTVKASAGATGCLDNQQAETTVAVTQKPTVGITGGSDRAVSPQLHSPCPAAAIDAAIVAKALQSIGGVV